MGLMSSAKYRLSTLFLCIPLAAVVAFVLRNGLTATSLDYVVSDDSGSARVSTERFDLVFHDFDVSSTEFHGAFQIKGSGASQGSLAIGNVRFSHDYQDGVLTLLLSNRELLVLERGTTMHLVREKRFIDINSGMYVLHFSLDGRLVSEKMAPR